MKKQTFATELPPLSQSIQYLDAEFRQTTLTENPQLLFSMIRVLEISVKAGMTPMILSVGYTPKGIQNVYRRCGEFILDGCGDNRRCIEVGRRAVVAHTEAEWSVLFALDKIMLSDLGFISAKDGDLRKAKLRSTPEQVLSLLRWKQFRDRPELLSHVISAVLKKGGARAKQFCRRLGEAVANAPFHLPDNVPVSMRSEHRRLQMFLLDNWAKEWTVIVDDPSKKLPPLYTFKNRAMFELLYELAIKARSLNKHARFQAVEKMDETSFSMVWRRLGLRRADTGYWGHVEWERSRRSLMPGKRLIIWDRKPPTGF